GRRGRPPGGRCAGGAAWVPPPLRAAVRRDPVRWIVRRRRARSKRLARRVFALTPPTQPPSITRFTAEDFRRRLYTHGCPQAKDLPGPSGQASEPPPPHSHAGAVLPALRAAAPAAPRLSQLRLLPGTRGRQPRRRKQGLSVRSQRSEVRGQKSENNLLFSDF